MRKLVLSGFTAAALGAGCLFLPTSAIAKDSPVLVTAPTELVVRHVSYADLDLGLPAGVTALNQRVNFAIGDVCAEANLGDSGSFGFKAGMMRCSNHAWDDARPQIARAVQRAEDIASTGSSQLAAAAITISVGR
jgi:UrcA family protein